MMFLMTPIIASTSWRAMMFRASLLLRAMERIVLSLPEFLQARLVHLNWPKYTIGDRSFPATKPVYAYYFLT